MNELELEALRLAVAELDARLAYERERILFEKLPAKKLRLFGYSKEEKQRIESHRLGETELEKCEEQVRECTARTDKIRSEIPNAKDRRFWWDVPFNARKPVSSAPGTFFFNHGTYIEQDDMESELCGRKHYLYKVQEKINGPWLLDEYSSPDNYMVIYVNKERLQTCAGQIMERKMIFACEMAHTQYETITYMNPDTGILPSIREACEEDVAFLEQTLKEDRARQDYFWDMLERFKYNSLYTNEERWGMGRQISAEDYFRDDLLRTMYRQDLEEKAQRKIMQRKYQAHREQIEYLEKFERTRKTTSQGNDILRIQRVGEVAYCGEELVAIVLFNQPQPITEISCSEEVKLTHLEGQIYGVREIMTKVPDHLPLFRHIIEQYGQYLPLYHVLDKKPRGFTDEEWRAWAELRTAHSIRVMEEFI